MSFFVNGFSFGLGRGEVREEEGGVSLIRWVFLCFVTVVLSFVGFALFRGTCFVSLSFPCFVRFSLLHGFPLIRVGFFVP